ncbi:MAG: rod shape-determining protein RodA [Flavobacteriaceae bacterium]|nr:rod shape-determining protein RodA [Bacteroidia bacterium]NNF75639.1 rod shape-determining protein RodA [Flavobacteriaceae bacterium]
MSSGRSKSLRLDWISIILFFLLVGFGYLNILSASASGSVESYFDMSQPYGKQMIFIIFSLVLIILILAIETKFYERFASLIYLISIISLIGLFIFGKNVNGATSWYAFGGMTIQPSEFAKFATALAVAKYVSDLQTNITEIKHQLRTFLIILVPAFLILLQNDAGSSVVYGAFFFVFFREGIPKLYLAIALGLTVVAVSTLKFGLPMTSIGSVILIFILYYLIQKKRRRIMQPVLIAFISVAFAVGIQFFYSGILQEHQQDRISVWLRLEQDPAKLEAMKRDISYNLHESEKAISSGGLTGKGFMEGTRTIGKFVPEQHTDYIFSTIGEEWGFLGSSLVVIIFVLLIIRIIFRAENQRSQFSRVYGYGVASILFMHFLINIGMVMGLLPTIGIPLPFFSYGGSSLWGFTILLFIFIKLDANRLNEW